MPTISTHDESNRELCLTCPLAECNDRSPQCPINKKRKAYFKEYRQINREKRQAQAREYYRANLEQRKAYFRARYAAKKMEAK